MHAVVVAGDYDNPAAGHKLHFVVPRLGLSQTKSQ